VEKESAKICLWEEFAHPMLGRDRITVCKFGSDEENAFGVVKRKLVEFVQEATPIY
jgi:hypothetical protein